MGRGIQSILGTTEESQEQEGEVRIEDIQPNPDQPRRTFDPHDLDQLAESIKASGVIQPIVVRKVSGGYELVAGERRLRASQQAGLKTIPIVVRQVEDDADRLALALVENVQRTDLDAIEKAAGFARLTREFKLSQEQVAGMVGLKRSTVANFVRLLDLPEDLQQLVSLGHLRMGHARAILGSPEPDIQRAVAAQVIKKGLSVRETEQLVTKSRRSLLDRDQTSSPPPEPPQWIEEMEGLIRARAAAKVDIRHRSNGGGAILIHYRDETHLREIVDSWKDPLSD